MTKKSFLPFALAISLLATSCQFFDKKVPDEETLLQEELSKINWKQVDQFPSAKTCDTLLNKEEQKQCLFQFLTENIQSRIGIDTIHILYPELDTIAVKVTINPDSKLEFETQQPTDSISYDIRIIDSILNNRLSDFPPIEPAIKQGVKVKSQFILPVILKVTE